ncbi:hypothetical protein D3C84_1311890 [compost metagenome]
MSFLTEASVRTSAVFKKENSSAPMTSEMVALPAVAPKITIASDAPKAAAGAIPSV